MNRSDDFDALAAIWRQPEPATPGSPGMTAALVQAAERKRRRMRILVALEVGCSLLATFAVGRGIANPAESVFTEGRSVWNWFALALVWVIQLVLLYERRAQWRTPTATVSDLLALARQRARTAIRLGWLNLAGLVLFIGVTVPFIVAEVAAGRHQDKLLLLGKVGIPVLLAAMLVLVQYVRRQRQELGRIESLRRELADEAPDRA